MGALIPAGPALRCALLAALVLPGRAAAQGRLVRAEMSVQLPALPGDARIRLRYVVQPAAGANTVPLSLLRPAGTLTSDITAHAADTRVNLVFDPDAPVQRASATLALPPAGVDSLLQLEFQYTVAVRQTDGVRVRLPVLAVMWPPAAATPGTFRAELVLPTGVVAWNAFPATLQAARGATASSYTFALPVVPSMFAFNLRSGAAPPLTLAGTLNGFVLLFIAAFCYLIWRQFRAQPA